MFLCIFSFISKTSEYIKIQGKVGWKEVYKS